MKLTTYLGIIAIGILLASLANADQPGNGYARPRAQQQQQQPNPIEQYPPNPSLCCGPNVRPLAVGGVCSKRQIAPYTHAIIMNGEAMIFRGSERAVYETLIQLILDGTCRQVH